MAQMPVEIVDIGSIPNEWIDDALAKANSIQKEFLYSRLPESDNQQFRMYAYKHIEASQFLDSMDKVRNNIRSYHPHVIAFIDANLDGDDYSNIFASNRGEKGLGVVTIANVPDVIIPNDRMPSYLLYYLAKNTLSFIVPNHKNHDDTRGCIYDRKILKPDLVDSMKPRAICTECRTSLLSEQTFLSPSQLAALDKMFETAGKILEVGLKDSQKELLTRVFIGSSTEGLEIANKIQELLQHDVSSEVWNQGKIFGLGNSSLESLEQAVLTYDFGIFIFTPDDQLHSRGDIKPVARDNVIFELGLFMGKLTRRRAFVIHPSKKSISLPTDLAGITLATYNPDDKNLSSALGPACNQIREAIKQTPPR